MGDARPGWPWRKAKVVDLDACIDERLKAERKRQPYALAVCAIHDVVQAYKALLIPVIPGIPHR